MTKFEEEVDKVAKQVGYESLSLLIGDCEEANKIYIHFKNWHSDEEFQELLDKYSNLNDNYEKEVIRSSKLESQITGLKSQLQQQALPVVPECVDLFIKECRKFNYDLDQAFYEQEDGSEATENNKCILWRRNHPDEFARAWLDGYTVEKPQLFYLRDELTGQFLAKDNQFKNEDRYFFWNGVDPLTHSIGTAWKLSFTQQEIDSMQTGSYELVPVEDE